MRIIPLLLLAATIMISCTDKKEREKPMPVETDNGIGDGAQSLDSLIQSNDNKTDTLTKDPQ